MFKWQICYIERTNLLPFTMNARKLHCQPQCTLQLVCNNHVLSWSSHFIMQTAASKMWVSNSFLRRSRLMLLELCLSVVIFKTCFFNTQSQFTLMALHEHFLCHTPGLTHATIQLRLRRDRPMFAVADFKPSDVGFNIRWSGLGTLRSGPAWANIFLTRVYRKSLYDIFLPPHEEWRMQLLRMARSNRWMNNFFIQFAASWLFLFHCRNYFLLGHCKY